jgi:hypothetical protein
MHSSDRAQVFNVPSSRVAALPTRDGIPAKVLADEAGAGTTGRREGLTATTSRSASLKSFRTTCTRSSKSSPCNGVLFAVAAGNVAGRRAGENHDPSHRLLPAGGDERAIKAFGAEAPLPEATEAGLTAGLGVAGNRDWLRRSLPAGFPSTCAARAMVTASATDDTSAGGWKGLCVEPNLGNRFRLDNR